MVSTTPWIVQLGVEVAPHASRRCDSSCDRPSSAKNSHCSGTSTRCRRGQRVYCQQVERRRAVDQDVGEAARIIGQRRRQAADSVAQPEAAVPLVGDLQLDAEQVEGRRGEPQPRHRRRQDRVGERGTRRPARRKVESLRSLRSMPSPVEALPCGSISMTSTRSPIAASAVPRLMAVVVLPTPPF